MILSDAYDLTEVIIPLNHGFKLIQRRRGHRAGSDDILLAALALEMFDESTYFLELGCGKATVSLMLLAARPGSRAVGIEVLEMSYDLACRNRALNNVTERLELVHGDLRHRSESATQSFEVIIGAPPYMPLGTGIMPTDPQRRAGRFELNGGVDAYFKCAGRHLAPNGRVLILMDGDGEARACRAAHAANLSVIRCTRVCPRPERPPTYCIIEASAYPSTMVTRSFAMRGIDGKSWSPVYQALRWSLGFDSETRAVTVKNGYRPTD